MRATMTIDEARSRDWPEIVIGESYEFVSEIEEGNLPAKARYRTYTGRMAKVIALLSNTDTDPDCSQLYIVHFEDGHEVHAWREELNGWDKALGQFYGPSGIYGDPS